MTEDATERPAEERAPSHHSTRTGPLPVGVYGASGTTGAELVRLLWGHPRVRLAFATARSAPGELLRSIEPEAPPVRLVHPDDVRPSDAELVFLCLPHGSSAPLAARCVGEGCRTIDLSGDLRLTEPALHERVYGSPRSEELARAAVYGLTETAREALPTASVVACPGCYATAAALALLPLAEAQGLGELPVIDAKSGASGAGRTPTPRTHFCSVNEDVRPYKLGRAHRHVAEIEQTLRRHDPAGRGHCVVFNPHLVPLERGIEETIVLRGAGLDAEGVRRLWQERYRGEPFVEVLPAGESARVRAVRRTNRAVLAAAPVDGVDAVVLSVAIDNLLKGAAGQAVQDLNVMEGWPETTGLAPAVERPAAR